MKTFFLIALILALAPVAARNRFMRRAFFLVCAFALVLGAAHLVAVASIFIYSVLHEG